ncbi:MAG: H-NS family nucleoid-associated regulatory protein [Phycisphaerales bacterium]
MAPKYRDPESGTTWSGRGRTPLWMVAAIEQGRTRDEFLIEK